MTSPAWLGASATDLVAALISTAESCSVELACLPHLRAAAEELASGVPSTQVDPLTQEAWRPVLSAVMTRMPSLLETAVVVPDAPRLHAAMIVLLESLTQGDPDPGELVLGILSLSRTLDPTLRELATTRDAARRARDDEQLAAAAAVPARFDLEARHVTTLELVA